MPIFTWGWIANPGQRNLNQIGNLKLRNMNDKLRKTKLPGNNWRVQDPGHLHIKKK